jgi:hypothetical protein
MASETLLAQATCLYRYSVSLCTVTDSGGKDSNIKLNSILLNTYDLHPILYAVWPH